MFGSRPGRAWSEGITSFWHGSPFPSAIAVSAEAVSYAAVMTDDRGSDLTPTPPPADGKDWTWVLQRHCPECGFDTAAVSITELPGLIRSTAGRWAQVLRRPDVRVRPTAAIWSPLEYAAHVRDVYQVFAVRARLMLEEQDPTFDNWDQDATAIEKRYHDSDPAQLTRELDNNADEAARVFGSVSAEQWNRTGHRSNGSVFTVDSLGRYFLHDVRHHLHDVGA